jgi:nucleotide-binding universal stress UspA family protein
LHVLHVAPKGAGVEKLQDIIKTTLKKVDYRKSTVTIQINSKIDTAIDSFVQQIKADLVTMFTHKKSAYDKLFNRSVTKKMAFQSKVPLLAFKAK